MAHHGDDLISEDTRPQCPVRAQCAVGGPACREGDRKEHGCFHDNGTECYGIRCCACGYSWATPTRYPYPAGCLACGSVRLDPSESVLRASHGIRPDEALPFVDPAIRPCWLFRLCRRRAALCTDEKRKEVRCFEAQENITQYPLTRYCFNSQCMSKGAFYTWHEQTSGPHLDRCPRCGLRNVSMTPEQVVEVATAWA